MKMTSWTVVGILFAALSARAEDQGRVEESEGDPAEAPRVAEAPVRWGGEKNLLARRIEREKPMKVINLPAPSAEKMCAECPRAASKADEAARAAGTRRAMARCDACGIWVGVRWTGVKCMETGLDTETCAMRCARCLELRLEEKPGFCEGCAAQGTRMKARSVPGAAFPRKKKETGHPRAGRESSPAE